MGFQFASFQVYDADWLFQFDIRLEADVGFELDLIRFQLGWSDRLFAVQFYLKIADTIQMDAFSLSKPVAHKVA